MKTQDIARLEKELAQCRQRLGALTYLSSGTVVRRAPGQTGSPYRWTRKVAGKTITVSLSETQYDWLKKAIANQRAARSILKRMEQISRSILFETIPGVTHRKNLSAKVLGLK